MRHYQSHSSSGSFAILLLVSAAVSGMWFAARAGASVPWADSAADQEPTIRIGLLVSLSGSAASTENEMVRGATLAAEQINATGGIQVGNEPRRRVIELIIADDETTPEGGIAAARWLVEEQNVDVVMGGFSSAVTLASQVPIAEHQVPFLIGGVSTPQVTRRTDIDTRWMFHYLEIGPYRGKAVAEFLADVVRPAVAADRKLRVALIYQDSAFGEDMMRGLPGLGIVGWSEAQDLPIEFVAQEKFTIGETDFLPQLQAILATDPDLVLPIAFESETIDIIHQAISQLSLETLWGPNCLCVDSPGFYRTMGIFGNHTLIETLFNTYDTPRGAEGELAREFRAAYLSRWGELPGLFGANQYDSVYILKQAIEDAGSLDKADVRDALENLDMPALTLPVEGGRIRFDSFREVRFDVLIVQLLFDLETGESRSTIVWPSEFANASFQLP